MKFGAKKRGFTLIEILIVIAIVGVLAGLLLGALMTARKKAQQISCMSNLRQIGMGLTMYVDDYGMFPVAINMPSLKLNDREPISYGLSQFLILEVFKCPMDTEEFFKKEFSSYEWQTRLNGKKDSRKTDKPLPALWDYEPFHGEEGKPKSRNILYTDGRAVGF